MTGSEQPEATPVISYLIARADGTVLAAKDEHRSFYAASTVKLAVLVALARGFADGSIGRDETLPSRDTFASAVPGAPDYRLVPDDVDHGMAPAGEPMTIEELARRMIVISSNEATNILLDRVGLAAVAQVLSDAGAEGVAMGRQYGDFAAAERYGRANYVSAAGLVALMSGVVTGALCADAELNGWMLGLLEAQEMPGLAKDLPEGVRWGSKSGSVDGLRHDFAFFGDPGPQALVLAVCTSGMEHETAGAMIATIGRLATQLAH